MSVAEKRCAMSRVKELKGGEKKLTALTGKQLEYPGDRKYSDLEETTVIYTSGACDVRVRFQHSLPSSRNSFK